MTDYVTTADTFFFHKHPIERYEGAVGICANYSNSIRTYDDVSIH